MQIRRSSLSILLCLIASPFAVGAAEQSPAEAAQAVVDSERKFFQTGQERGTRAAFLAFLADDGVVFRPGPVNGKEAWSKRPENGLELIWEPTFAVIARSGDFGYDTGPAKWKAKKEDEKPLGYGYFVSIWKKQKDGSWKVALDLGIETPAAFDKPAPLRMVVPEGEPKSQVDAEARRKALEEARSKFLNGANANSTDGTLAVAAEEIRVYRDGSFPAIGQSAAAELLRAKSGQMSFESMGGDMSSSADLAYAYGKYSLIRNGIVEPGHFFQIWQTDKTGSWKLLLDWQQPLPKEKS